MWITTETNKEENLCHTTIYVYDKQSISHIDNIGIHVLNRCQIHKTFYIKSCNILILFYI